MIFHVNEVEALWVTVTAAGVLLTLLALLDAIAGFRVAKTDDSLSHEARELTAAGNVRREFLRLIVNALLMSIAIPALFSDRPIMLSPVLVALILVPIVLLINTAVDARDRGQLARLLMAMVKEERSALATEASVQMAIEAAHAAYTEANHVNNKIAALTAALGHKEDRP